SAEVPAVPGHEAGSAPPTPALLVNAIVQVPATTPGRTAPVESATAPASRPASITRGVVPGPTSVRVGETLETDLTGPSSDVCVPVYTASLAGGGRLPDGAAVDRDGHFRWSPREGQIGTYRFVFVRSLCETVADRRVVEVTVVRR